MQQENSIHAGSKHAANIQLTNMQAVNIQPENRQKTFRQAAHRQQTGGLPNSKHKEKGRGERIIWGRGWAS